MKVFSFYNSKGGVFKTGFTVEIAALLKKRGYRVLVIDLDEQSSLSKYLLADLSGNSIWHVLHTECLLKDAIQKNEFFDLVCGSERLAKADRQFIDADDRYILADELKTVEGDYDFVFIDDGPTRGILVEMTLCACDYVIIPSQPDKLSTDQVQVTMNEIDALRNNRNHDSHAEVICLLLTNYEQGTNQSVDALEAMLSVSDLPLYTLSKSTHVGEARTYAVPFYKTVSAGSKLALELDEIVDYVEGVYKSAEQS